MTDRYTSLILKLPHPPFLISSREWHPCDSPLYYILYYTLVTHPCNLPTPSPTMTQMMIKTRAIVVVLVLVLAMVLMVLVVGGLLLVVVAVSALPRRPPRPSTLS